MHHRMDDIPTVPNSPAGQFERATQSPSPALSLADWSEIDMMSSIESLARNSPRPPSNHTISSAERRFEMSIRERNSSISNDSSSAGNLSQTSPTHSDSSSSPSGSDSASASQYDFVMPSLPQINHSVDEPVVGLLHLAVSGASGKAVLNSLSSQMFEKRKEIKEDGMETHVCSSSICEHNNVVMQDANFVPKEVSKWLETQLQREAPIDLVIYTLEASGPTEEDIAALIEIQKLAEVAIVIAYKGRNSKNGGNHQYDETDDYEDNDDDDEDLVEVDPEYMLNSHGITGFQKRVWYINTQFERNWNMTSSQVEAPGYKAFIPSHERSDLTTLVAALTRSSGRIRATAAMLQTKWFQSQLVVTVSEPAGALAHRVNLRRKALESIGNLDPLGIAQWSSIPKMTAALVTGIVSGTLAVLGVSAIWSRLLCSSPVQPTCKRHAIFDMENWPQWLI